MKAVNYEVVTVYVPNSPKIGKMNGKDSFLCAELIEWLTMMYGYQAPNSYHFIANLDNNAYGWAWGRSSEPMFVQSDPCWTFMFKKESDALMFKLTWGGH
jgi:hypothetical protein